jgi:glycosyltransferase involved in cell wall biosynthesis
VRVSSPTANAVDLGRQYQIQDEFLQVLVAGVGATIRSACTRASGQTTPILGACGRPMASKIDPCLQNLDARSHNRTLVGAGDIVTFGEKEPFNFLSTIGTVGAPATGPIIATQTLSTGLCLKSQQLAGRPSRGSPMSNLTVGYVYDKYFTRRNVIGLARNCEYRLVSDRYKYLQKAAHLLNILARSQVLNQHDLANQFHDWPLRPQVDVLHLFNQINFGRTPWVVTFETTIPRFRSLLNCHHGRDPDFSAVVNDSRVAKAIHALASPPCKRLIALSACAQRIEDALTVHVPRAHEAISAKIVVQHPPQAKLIDSVELKDPPQGRDIRFLFVGASFFRKGGVEIIETLQQLRRQRHFPLQLTIVSTLAIDNYATQETPADQTRAREIIDANRAWITYHPQLDNDAVLQLMRTADVGLLPTYADTYGYVVLEFQAAGCPVITTDVRALPEINDERTGWLIAVPKNRLGEALYTSAAEREHISRAIRAGLTRCVEEIFADRNVITVKAERALQRIADHHAPTRVAEQLQAIYATALCRKNTAPPLNGSRLA